MCGLHFTIRLSGIKRFNSFVRMPSVETRAVFAFVRGAHDVEIVEGSVQHFRDTMTWRGFAGTSKVA